MALVLTDEQAMLRDSARGLLEKNAPVSHLRALRDERDAAGFSRALWLKFAEMGFTGILVPEAFGGSGLGHVEAGVVMQEIGRADFRNELGTRVGLRIDGIKPVHVLYEDDAARPEYFGD